MLSSVDRESKGARELREFEDVFKSLCLKILYMSSVLEKGLRWVLFFRDFFLLGRKYSCFVNDKVSGERIIR